MWVRTRNQQDAEAIAALTDATLNKEIMHWANRDYEWRFLATREEVQGLMLSIVEELDYDNFKNRATESTPHNKSALYGVYNATYKATDLYVEAEATDYSKWWTEPRLFDDIGNPHYADYGDYEVDNTNYVEPIETPTIFEKFADWLEG
jgi:hypothetical protein